MPVPYPNFAQKLTVSNDGKTVTIAGPLKPEDTDLASIHLFAIVAQAPQSSEPNGDPDGEPKSATARGDAPFDPWQENWQFTADTVDGTPFQEGWAFATAIAVNLQKNGPIETYSWSRWVWLKLRP